MNNHEYLVNNESNVNAEDYTDVCSFQKDELEDVCSYRKYDTCGDGSSLVPT